MKGRTNIEESEERLPICIRKREAFLHRKEQKEALFEKGRKTSVRIRCSLPLSWLFSLVFSSLPLFLSFLSLHFLRPVRKVAGTRLVNYDVLHIYTPNLRNLCCFIFGLGRVRLGTRESDTANLNFRVQGYTEFSTAPKVTLMRQPT